MRQASAASRRKLVRSLVLGTVLLGASFAYARAATGLYVEPENGLLLGTASVVEQASASGGAYVTFGTAPEPPTPAGKPTDASTGPRIATTNAPGGTISGTHSGKRFTGDVTITGSATLTDCVIEGELMMNTNSPVTIEYCDINGWFGFLTNNTDPNKHLLTMRHSKVVGPRNNDTMRIGSANSWGDHSRYMNTLIEDSIIHSPYDSFGPDDHFDLLQFGGGRNSVFNRVVFSYVNNPYHPNATNYLNNGVGNSGVIFNNIWIEGGPVGYVLAGPMTINTCIINRSTRQFGYVYPMAGTVLNNCADDTGAAISGT